MVYEKLDKYSGAILFKKDHESLKLEEVYQEVVKLRNEVAKLSGELKQYKEQLSK